MIKVIRYSVNGFEPQYQSHHLAENQVCVNEDAAKEFLASVSEGLRPIIASTLAENSKFIKAHWEDLQNGIWVFIDGHKNNQSLNHLKNITCFLNDICCLYRCIQNQILVVEVHNSSLIRNRLSSSIHLLIF